jgi:hypothetical protein
MENTVDLQNFVGRRVKVLYKNGQIKEGVISEDSDFKELYNYYFNGVAYTRCGSTYGVLARDGFHIVNVESIEEADKYERLVAEVLTLRKEVEELKSERSGTRSVAVATPEVSLKPMRVTRSFVIQPEEYFEYCLCYGEEPSQEGYIYFAKLDNDDMFTDEGTYEETVEEVEE